MTQNIDGTLRVAWLVGDGVGLDVMEATKFVLDAARMDIEFFPADVGWNYWCLEGNALPDRTVDVLKQTHCALLGPIISKPRDIALRNLSPDLKGKGLVYQSPVVRLRQEFGLTTRVRPCRAYPGNPLNFKDNLDITVIIENTEGLFCGVEYDPPAPRSVRKALARTSTNFGPYTALEPQDVAISTRILTRPACRAVLQHAFDFAEMTQKDRVTLADKPTVLRATGGLMVDTALNVAAKHPSIRLEQMDVDKLCMLLLRKPEHYQVIVASSLFGSIIGDICLQLCGGMGMAPTAALGDDYAVFQPYHGPAPRFAGQYKVNPMGTLLSAALMLDWAGKRQQAKDLRDAVAAVVADGRVLTYDLGGTSSTMEVAQAIANAMLHGSPLVEGGVEAPALMAAPGVSSHEAPPDPNISSQRFGDAPETAVAAAIDDDPLSGFSLDGETLAGLSSLVIDEEPDGSDD